MGSYNFVFFKNKNITKYVIIHESFLIGKNLPKNKKVEVLLRLTKTISKKIYDFDMSNPKAKNELTIFEKKAYLILPKSIQINENESNLGKIKKDLKTQLLCQNIDIEDELNLIDCKTKDDYFETVKKAIPDDLKHRFFLEKYGFIATIADLVRYNNDKNLYEYSYDFSDLMRFYNSKTPLNDIDLDNFNNLKEKYPNFIF